MRLAYETSKKFLKILRKYKNIDLSYNKCKNGFPPHEYKLNP
jgi:hypothetical protein